MTQAVTDANFQDEVLNSKGLVLVDFWAPWCGPCRAIAPILDEISAEMGSSVKIVKVNIDENPQSPSQFNVRSIPTLLLFKDGQLNSNQVGSQPKSRLIEWIQGAL
jgi:thioredoxin 1